MITLTEEKALERINCKFQLCLFDISRKRKKRSDPSLDRLRINESKNSLSLLFHLFHFTTNRFHVWYVYTTTAVTSQDLEEFIIPNATDHVLTKMWLRWQDISGEQHSVHLYGVIGYNDKDVPIGGLFPDWMCPNDQILIALERLPNGF